MMLGLTLEQLAKLAEAPYSTIERLEAGELPDLGYNELSTVLSLLSMELEAHPLKGLGHGLVVAARSVSTSYRNVLEPEALADMLESGLAPVAYHPHLMALLEEVPLPVVMRAIYEVAKQSTKATLPEIMHYMAQWASEFRVRRAVW